MNSNGTSTGAGTQEGTKALATLGDAEAKMSASGGYASGSSASHTPSGLGSSRMGKLEDIAACSEEKHKSTNGRTRRDGQETANLYVSEKGEAGGQVSGKVTSAVEKVGGQGAVHVADKANEDETKPPGAPIEELEEAATVTDIEPFPLVPSVYYEDEQLPGAYAATPGGRISRTTAPSLHLVGVNNNDTSNATLPSTLPSPSHDAGPNHQLVQANPVEDPEDDPNIGKAKPVNVEQAQTRQLERKKQVQHVILALFFLCAVAAFIVSMLVTTRDKAEVDSMPAEEMGVSYVSPSGVPSLAPTGNLDLLLEYLPDYTIASINKGSDTPQWKAWNWISNHQNVTNLPEWRKMQLFALATFFYAFAGEDWPWYVQERWVDDKKDECLWFSSGHGTFYEDGSFVEWSEYPGSSRQTRVPCNDHGEFTLLMLWNLKLNGLTPSVPPEIALLTSLTSLSLALNNIEGPLSAMLPPALYQSPNISELSFLVNDLTGSIPTELGLWTQMTRLDFFRNDISGEVPTEIGLLQPLEYLSLGETELTGQIPSEVGLLSALTWLHIDQTRVSGILPTQLGSCPSLRHLLLSSNQLSGSTPSELGMLLHVTRVQLKDNNISGTIPTELGLLTANNQLWMAGNQLSGTVPSEIGNMHLLVQLLLQNNNLTGPLPKELNVTFDLRLQGNQFSGLVPGHLCTILGCDCSSPLPMAATCIGLKGVPGWPGRFPDAINFSSPSDSILLNIFSSPFPQGTAWAWQKQETVNDTNIWETLQGSGGGLQKAEFMYSITLPIEPGQSYQLVVSDSFGDGIKNGWLTLTGAKETVVYSYVEKETLINPNVTIPVSASHVGRFKQIAVELEVGNDGLTVVDSTVQN